jgi:hypothetical protein
MSTMRTVPDTTNQPLRDAITYRRAPLDLLLASTVALAHDGTLQVDRDGALPKGRPLPLGIARGRDGAWLLGAYTDREALAAPDAPTDGDATPTVAITGDDLVVLAAANDVGLHLNPGSRDDLVLGTDRVRELAHGIRTRRARASVRRFGDERVLVTMRPRRLGLEEDRHALLLRELVARGIGIAYVVEYCLHQPDVEPQDFTQLAVVGDAHGEARWQLREDARRVVEFLTGIPTDAVSCAAMPQAARISRPLIGEPSAA